MTNKRVVVAITGASGAIYAKRLLFELSRAGIEIHLVVSPLGQRLLHDELGLERIDPAALCEKEDHGVTIHGHRDVGAAIASGSFIHDGMIVCPCSNNTLASIANGVSGNLVTRAANVCLKERRRLILAHREMPLGLTEIRNMQQATEAGAIIAPTNPGFYMIPQSIDELVGFVVGRLLDLIGVEHDINVRWTDSPANFRSE